MLQRKRVGILMGAALALGASVAGAAPQIRFQQDLHGDFLLVGNTLGQDCSNGTPAPVVGTVGACGSNVSDSSPDVFWRADDPAAGQARADVNIAAPGSRSTAILTIPAGATVAHARLYWSALDALADTTALVERPGSFSTSVTADVTHTIAYNGEVLYESSADVTALVAANGSGAYRIGDVASIQLANLNEKRAHAAWSLVVAYERAADPLRQVTLFDGLDAASTGSGVVVNLSGFLVPLTGIDAKLGIVAYGTDGQTGGDTLTWNGTSLSDGLGSNDFFNGTRSLLGVPAYVAGDLPQLTGGARSMSAVDMDVVNVTSLVAPGATSASVVAKSGGDQDVLVGVMITSVTTFKPNFDGSLKTAVDVNGGALLAGDTIHYSIAVTNSGNDPGLGVVLNDVIPTGVTFVPGSITIAHPTAASKTDAAGDDEAEYLSASRTVRARLGSGATATTGGQVAIGDVWTVGFDVTVGAGAIGTLSNQATISASGLNGAPVATFTSANASGGPTTDVVVSECATSNDCPSARPHCLLSGSAQSPNVCVACVVNADCSGKTPVCDATHTCVACTGDASCTDPAAPACQTTGALAGACTECSAGNASLCGGSKPQCLTTQGICGCSSTDGDSECGGPTSGSICNGPTGICVPGCSTAPTRNNCPSTQFCSDQTGGVGTCSPEPCNTSADCSAPKTVCDTTPVPHVCVQCLQDAQCTSPFVCDTTSKTCAECTPTKLANCSATGNGAVCLATGTCGCVADDDCGSATSGRICDAATSKCVSGCRGSGGNGCPSQLVCTSTNATAGTCVTCVSNATCAPPTPLCDTSSHACVACLGAADCPSSAPVCSAGVCVGCASDGDCKNPLLPACQLSGALQGACTTCSTGNLSLCTVDAPQCLPTGTCGCSSTDGDSECGGPFSGRICSGPAGTCVDGCSVAPTRNDCPATEFCTDRTGGVGQCLPHCTSAADCTTAPNLACDTSVIPHVCVQCVTNGDCPASTVCDTTRRQCVGCLANTDCPTPQVCNALTETCVGCMVTADCASGVCSPSQTCVGCVTNTDCPAPAVCDGTTSTCVGCVSSTDCAAPLVCDGATRTCVGCVSSADCVSPSVCDAGLHVCVGCVTSADCTAPDVCDTTVHQCVRCLTTSDCTAPAICDGTTHQCVGCLSNGDCTAPQVCDTTARQCVGCVTGADCTPPQVCDPTARQCVGCTTNGDCTAPEVCDTSTQRCVRCLTSTDCTAPEVCDTTTDTCVRCLTGADCTSPEVCDIVTRQCVGCTADSDCVSPAVCNTGNHQCVGCTANAGCVAPDVCDTSTATCVRCLSDSDCTAPDVCDVASHSCVQCTPTSTGNCNATGTGSACLTNGTCGCTTDADCAGRLCDPNTSTCTTAPTDGGAPATDGGAPDSGTPKTDSGAPKTDGGGVLTPDGGVPATDAGVPAIDAGGKHDGGAKKTDDNVVEGGGCSCSLPRRSETGSPLALLGALALLTASGARRRNRSARR